SCASTVRLAPADSMQQARIMRGFMGPPSAVAWPIGYAMQWGWRAPGRWRRGPPGGPAQEVILRLSCAADDADAWESPAGAGRGPCLADDDRIPRRAGTAGRPLRAAG